MTRRARTARHQTHQQQHKEVHHEEVQRACVRRPRSSPSPSCPQPASAGAGEAKAGTYPMYACDVPGVYLASPTKAAWRYYDNAGQVSHIDTCVTQPNRGGVLRVPDQLPDRDPPAERGRRPGARDPVDRTAVGDLDRARRRLDRDAADRDRPRAGARVGPQPRRDGRRPPPAAARRASTAPARAAPAMTAGHCRRARRTRRLGVLCSYMGGGYGNCTLPSPFLRIRGLKTTLREDVQPTAAIDGGTLASGGSHTGTETVTYSAADGESGVERVDVLLDGVVVATANDARDLSRQVIQQTGDCEYIGLRACPATTSGTLSVNTAGVPDGAYALEVRATDAAGNARIDRLRAAGRHRQRARHGRHAARTDAGRGRRGDARHDALVTGRRRRRTTASAPRRTRRCARRSPRAAAASSRAGTARRC